MYFESDMKYNREQLKKMFVENKIVYYAGDADQILNLVERHLGVGEEKCAGCHNCIESQAQTGEQCVKTRDCWCHKTICCSHEEKTDCGCECHLKSKDNITKRD